MTRALLAAGLVCLAGITLPAFRRSQSPPPPFRSSVDLVHLDVSVLDRNRRPVRGLTPADFTVLETGVPQEISVFTAVEIEEPGKAAAEWTREVAPDVRTNDGIEERRLFLLIIDDGMIEADAEAIRNTRETANEAIDRMGPSDLAAVIFTRDNRNSQDYTADRARLRAAVDKFSVAFRDMSPLGGDEFYWLSAAGVVQQAAEALSKLPDRRKSIIYIGQGVPVDPALAAPQAMGLSASGGGSAMAEQALVAQVRFLMERGFKYARLANVSVYTVDVCGLRVIKPPAPITPGGLPGRPPTCQPGLEVDYLQAIAINTKARAFINNNDFDKSVQAIFDENASYYLLGYRSSKPAQDAKFRPIEVRVNRPGVEVRARSGYEPEKPRDAVRRRAEIAKAPLGAALAGILPKSDLSLDATALAVPVPGKKESAVAISVRVRQPIRAGDQRRVERVDLQVSAFDTEGKHFGSSRYQADVTLRPGGAGTGEYEVLSRLNLRPGRYQLRIAAHVGSPATSGSVYYDVDVPDISKAALSLSPIVLSVSPGPLVAPRDALTGVLPVLPTTRRTFSAGDAPAAFVRVYQGGKSDIGPITLRLLLQDQAGRPVMERSQDLPAATFRSARSADVRVELPVAQLASGPYLLTIETGPAVTPVRRVVRFQVER
ncbi:MAG: VWA domain-containing protein [Acidobacteriota bacterium]|nr:VWA domain-containing protein [Acidobacteriota bacterium]